MDARKIKNNHKLTALILFIGVCLIPVIYCCTYVASVWDVYGQTGNLPVAVVNLDEGSTKDGEKVNYGTKLEEKLSENDNMKWSFVGAAEAKEGLEVGEKYYAVITIPKDFSKKLLSTATRDKTQATITYSANEKRNYIAYMILKSAMGNIKDAIKTEENKVVIGNLVDKLNAVPESLTTVNDAVGKLEDGSGQLQTGYNSLLTGSERITSNLGALDRGLATAKDGSKKLSDGANKSTDLISGLKQISDGASKLSESTESMGVLSDSISTASNGSKQIASGSKSLTNGIEKVSAGLNQLDNGVTAGVTEAKDKISTNVDTAMKKASTGLSDKINEGIETALDTALGTNSAANIGIKDYVDGVNSYKSNVDKLIALVNAGQGNSVQAQTLANGLSTAGTNIEKSGNSVKSIPSNVIEGINATLPDKVTKGIETGLTGKGGVGDQLKGGITTGVDALSTQVSAGINQVNMGINGVDGSGKLPDGSSALLAGSKTLSTGATSLESGLSELTEKTANLSDLNAGANKLAEGSKTAYEGSKKLSGLSKGVDDLFAGITTAKDGASQLEAGSKTLTAGIAKAQDGNSQVLFGLGKLDTSLTSSIDNTKNELEVTVGLAEASSDGIAIESNPFDHVLNYGESFAPYFMNISLWVGALISLMTIYYDYKRRLHQMGPGSTRPWRRFFIFCGLAIAQAVIACLVCQFGLRLDINNTAEFYLGSIAIALTYTWIIEFLMVVVGDVGKMLAMILMVLQLTSTGGTFPIELNPPFFRVISPFLPMTYGIKVIKEAISGSNIAIWGSNLGFLMIFAGIGLAALFIGRTIQKSIHKDEVSTDKVGKVLRKLKVRA